MNKNLYRIIFNKSRGMLMVVSDIARSGRAGSSPSSGKGAEHTCLICKVGVLSFSLWLAAGSIQFAQANIVADSNAPSHQQPMIINSANGTPQINIQTPSAGGVSRNTYSQFDVNQQGAILNNSHKNVQTELGGMVTGNPWLAGGEAKIILNEVNSRDPSRLNGFVEVAGRKAEIVIANPSGITCNGCGFINANRAMLTTGQAQMNNGNLTGFNVERGQVVVEGTGMDSSRQDYTDIISRSVKINAGVWANDLKVTTGRNKVDAAHDSIAKQNDDPATRPQMALDVATLGGMYAGKIRMVGTESGVGVRNMGNIGAQAGSVVVTSDGRIENSGSLRGSGDVQLVAKERIRNEGAVFAGGNASVTSAADVQNKGTIAASNDVQLQVASLNSEKGSVLAAGVQSDGKIGTAGSLSLTSEGRLTARGQNLAGGNLAARGQGLDISGSQTAAQNIRLDARDGTLITRDSHVIAQQQLTANSSTLLNNEGGSLTADKLSLTAHDLSNQKGRLTQTGSDPLTLSHQGVLNNREGQIATNSTHLILNADTLDNQSGEIVHAGNGRLAITTHTQQGRGGKVLSGGQLSLRGGDITLDSGTTSARHIEIDANSLSNRQGSLIQKGSDDMRLYTRGVIDNQGGQLGANGHIEINAAALNNQTGQVTAAQNGSLKVQVSGVVDNRGGQLAASGDVSLMADHLDNGKGLVSAAAGEGRVSTRKVLANQAGRIETGKALTLATDGLENQNGQVIGNTITLALGKQALNNQGGVIAATDLLRSDSGALNNDAGLLQAGGDATVDTQGAALSNRQSGDTGGILSQGTLTLHSGELDNRQGMLTGGGDMVVKTKVLNNTGGTLVSKKQLLIDSNGVLTNDAGLLQSGGDTTVNTHGHALSNRNSGDQGGIRSQGKLDLAAGDTDNRQGIITGKSDVALQVEQLNNGQGQLAAGQALSVSATDISNQGGAIKSGQGMELNVAQRLDNSHQGVIGAGQHLDVNSSDILNNQGTLVSGGAGSIHFRTLDNQNGHMAAQRALDVRGRHLNNENTGLIQSGERLAITVDTLHNRNSGDKGGMTSQGDMTIVTDTIDNEQGVALSGKMLQLDAGQLSNAFGKLVAQESLAIITTRAALNNQSGLLQGKHVQLDTSDQQFDNQQGTLYSLGDLTAKSGKLDNQAGTIGAKGDLNAQTEDFDNRNGGRVVSKQSAKLQTANLDNRNGQIQSVGDLVLDSPRNVINNMMGLIRSGASVTLNALHLNNQKTQNPQQGIEGQNVTVHSDSADNQQGLLLANQQLSVINQGLLDNRQGQLSAGETLSLHGDSLTLTNTNGVIKAGRDLAVTADSMDGEGQLLSLGNIHLVSRQNLSNRGEMIANNNFTVTTSGDITNSGKLLAGAKLDLHANNLFNKAPGEINAGQNWLTVANTLINHGLIDGKHTLIRANTLTNIGSGRIYGDAVGIQTITFNNLAEKGMSATLAGRERVDIGTRTLNNRDHALIYSAGDMAIGGQLDADHQATGKAGTINNQSSTIESAGNMQLSVGQINNVNDHFSTELVNVSSEKLTEYQHSGDPVRWKAGELGVFVDRNSSDSLLNLNTPGRTGGGNDNFNQYDYTRTVQETRIKESDPARIIAGGNMKVNADRLFNDKSQIIAGGTLTVKADFTDNVDVPGQHITTDIGKVTHYHRIRHKGSDEQGDGTSSYTPPAIIQNIKLKPSQLIDHGQVDGNPVAIASRVSQGTEAAIGSTGGVNATVSGSTLTAGSPAISAGSLPDMIAVTLPPGQQFEVKSRVIQQQGEPARVVRIVGPDTRLPDNSLFKTNPSPDGHYLVETDPRFTNMKKWLGSDYMQAALTSNSDNVLKRLGDGYYEQRLIREQVINLTGQRYLAGYHSDEEQFKALMDQGIAFSKQYNLKAGVALTPEQMGLLTQDMVWLVNAQVTLPDGSQQTVLVPQVYARVNPGDLDGSGALIAGRHLNLDLSGSLINRGTLAGREVVKLNADNITNIAGTIRGADVGLNARTDINNIGGVLLGTDTLLVNAGRDINAISTILSAQNVNGANRFERTAIDSVAGIYVQGADGKLVLQAGRDITLDAAKIVNSGEKGQTVLQAGHDLKLNTVTTSGQDNIIWDGNNSLKQGNTRQVGSEILSQGDIALNAGHDLTAHAAIVSAKDTLQLNAGHDINIASGENTQNLDERHKVTGGNGWLSKTTITTTDIVKHLSAQSSEFSGDSVQIKAGHDLNVQGSTIVGTHDIVATADHQLNITTAEEVRDDTHLREEKKSGLMSSGGIGFTIGKQKELWDEAAQTQTGKASMIGSLKGNTVLQAGQHYQQTGSTVSSPEGNVIIRSKSVTVEAAETSNASQYEHTLEKKGLTLAVNVPVVQAVQGAIQSVQRVGKSNDDRVNALAAANAAWDAHRAGTSLMNSAQGIIDNGVQNVTQNVSISLTYGENKQKDTRDINSTTALASKINAGKQAVLIATGGEQSDITVTGSDVSGKQGTKLLADNEVKLQAAEQKRRERTDNTSSGWNAGIAASYGQGGASFGITAGANLGKGHGNGDDRSWLNSHIGDMSSQTQITSGGATTLKGAQITGSGVKISAENLNIESLQDTMTYAGKQQDISGQVTAGYGVSASGSFSQSKVNADYASVQEQSGIFAGKEGYQIDIRDHTDLTGGLITSSASAEQSGNNRFSTGTLSWRDIKNHAEYSGSSVGISGSASMNTDLGLGGNAATQSDKVNVDKGGKTTPATGIASLNKTMSAGVGHDSGSEKSTTHSGINTANIIITNPENQQQAIEGVKTDITTETAAENSGRLENNFDKDNVFKELNLQVAVTKDFKTNANRQISEYVDDKQASARQTLKEAMAAGDAVKQQQALDDIYKLQYQRRFLQVLVGVVAGSPDAAITQQTLAIAATKMREETVKNSFLSPPIVDRTGQILSNVSGDSSGSYDGLKMGGSRMSLDVFCAENNTRCVTPKGHPEVLEPNSQGFFEYKGDLKHPTFTELLKDKSISADLDGDTGGFQGAGGRVGPIDYKPGTFWGDMMDTVVEGFAGTHDFIGGQLPGFYDEMGNVSRGREPMTNIAAETWTVVAIPLATPFAVSEIVSPELLEFIFAAGK